MKVPSLKRRSSRATGTPPAQRIAPEAAAQKRAQRQFQALLEAAPDAMLMVNPTGKIVQINAQAEKLFGYGPHELLGKSL